MSGANVLIVDDERGMRDLLAMELTQLGHRVATAPAGDAAVAMIDEEEYDLVITDLRMPGASGITVLKAAKEASPSTEVIVATGYADMDAAAECVRCGAFDLLRKPFALPDLLGTVQRALDHQRVGVTARLYAACREMLGSGHRRPLVERIAHSAMALHDADDASVMLLDASKSLRIAYATGIPDAVRADTRLALGERIAGRVALDGVPVILPASLEEDPRFSGIRSFGRVRSGLVCPLVHEDTLLGILTVNRVRSRRRFRQADLEVAGIVAAQAALALYNERMTQHLAFSERMSAVGQLAAGIVHEVNNPLTHILANIGYAEELLRGLAAGPEGVYLTPKTADEVLASLADAADGAASLKDLVADMRGLCRNGNEELDVIDVSKAVETALRIARPTLRGSADVTVTLPPAMMVRGDLGRLSQVFLNLFVNAAQALASSPKSWGVILVRGEVDDEAVFIHVDDDGPGIAPAHLDRIMEPFFTTKPRDQGTGLGLAICRQIVEEHGGALSVDSWVGRGTTFTVRLPRAVSASTSPA